MLKIDTSEAEVVLRTEADAQVPGLGNGEWIEKVEKLSELCEAAGIRTHVAFLGAALLAKSVEPQVSLKWIKPTVAKSLPEEVLDDDVKYAFSIRPLSENVLVPICAELGIHLGVTGRQPLNNQPYFRMRFFGDDTPIQGGGAVAFSYLVELINEIQSFDADQSRAALRAFLIVRRKYQPVYAEAAEGAVLTPTKLAHVVAEFVAQNSEGGKRAQACTAGLFDVVYGPQKVISGKINDPSRKHPGDVNVLGADEQVFKAIEVKDKPASNHDVQIFAQKALDMGTSDITYVAVAKKQDELSRSGLRKWGSRFGMQIEVFLDWPSLVEQCLYWGAKDQIENAAKAVKTIHNRLIEIEVSPETIEEWNSAVLR